MLFGDAKSFVAELVKEAEVQSKGEEPRTGSVRIQGREEGPAVIHSAALMTTRDAGDLPAPTET